MKVEGKNSWDVDSCLTGFELKVQAWEIDKWERVEDGQKYKSQLGL